MKQRFVGWLVLVALVALPGLVDAQDLRTVTGQVTAVESQQPLGAVRVTVKGTLISTVTDREGRFTLQVPANATALVFTGIGFKLVEVPVQSEVQVAMERHAVILEGLVVTALGVEREKRSLGTSVQGVAGADASAVPELNFLSSLQGLVAGVQITDAGPTGGTSRIIIRGSSSIAGDNQPLIVVDGIPIDNSAAGAG